MTAQSPFASADRAAEQADVPAISIPADAPAANGAAVALPGKAPSPALVKIEKALDYLGDFLNPILVKEARQAMKSRQFSVTFSLLLILGWVWTVGFIAFYNLSLYYQSYGVRALVAYFVLLTIPLLLVIPFATFRSMASESEDGTFELMSITTLSARQIILGKLASAILQMIVYYSALAPCIAFTYLLRGVDIVTIGLLLVHTFLASVLLSSAGLAAATMSRSRMWQVLVSVLLIIGLLGFTIIYASYAIAILFAAEGAPAYDEWYFWGLNLAAVSFMLGFSGLFVMIAAGQITFASENRSTPIRLMLVVIHLLIIGWPVYLWRSFPYGQSDYWLVVMEFFAAAYWMITGAILTGEMAELSPRAKRSLPQSLLGRSLLTWFNPGSGSGYTFAVLNLAGVLFLHVAVVSLASLLSDGRAPTDLDWFYIGITLLGYVAFYLGCVRLLVILGRMFLRIEMLMVFLLHVAVALAGIFIPLAVASLQYSLSATEFEYSLIQVPNWTWTLYDLAWRGTTGGVGPYTPILILFLGGIVWLLNLLEASVEVQKVRTVAPQRVLEDEAALHPAPAPQPKNPWDEERVQGSGFGVQEGAKEVREQRSESREEL